MTVSTNEPNTDQHAPVPEPTTPDAFTAYTYLRPFLSLSDLLPDGTPQEAMVRIGPLRALLIERGEQNQRLARMTETLVDVHDHRNQLVKDLTECAQATPGEYWRTVAAQHQPGALASPQPPAPHQVTVTRLPAAFDLSDKREHELLITDNATGGWISHLVRHTAACHRLPYGEICWFDEEWENGEYIYDDIAPGLYEVRRHQQDVGDHRGEFSHTESYLDYQRIGDAPERPAPAAADTASCTGKAPF